MNNFKQGDKVIWDSHFGYEIGYFRAYGNYPRRYLIEIRSGKYWGLISWKKSIHPYSNELIDKLTKQYGYEKRFSEIF